MAKHMEWFPEEDIANACMKALGPVLSLPGVKHEREFKIDRRNIADLIIETRNTIHVVEFKVTADYRAVRQVVDYCMILRESTERDVKAHIVARFLDWNMFFLAKFEQVRMWRAVEGQAPSSLEFKRERHKLSEDEYLRIEGL